MNGAELTFVVRAMESVPDGGLNSHAMVKQRIAVLSQRNLNFTRQPPETSGPLQTELVQGGASWAETRTIDPAEKIKNPAIKILISFFIILSFLVTNFARVPTEVVKINVGEYAFLTAILFG